MYVIGTDHFSLVFHTNKVAISINFTGLSYIHFYGGI